MSTLYAQIRTFIDETAGPAFFPDAQLYAAANWAQIEAKGGRRAGITSAPVQMTVGDPLLALPLTSVMIPLYVESGNQIWEITTYAKMEQTQRDWATVDNAAPQLFIRHDAEHLRVWPTPDAAYIVNIWGMSWPTELGALNQDTSDPDVYKLSIAHLAAAQLMKYTLPQFAEMHEQEGQMLNEQYHKMLRNNQSHQIRRLRPGGAWDTHMGGYVDPYRRFRPDTPPTS